MMKWIILLLAQKEVVVIALMRNQIVLEQKSLPLVPQPVDRMALLCQKEGKGDIYQRSLPSLLTLLNLEEGCPVREISLPDGSPDLQPTQMKDPRQENRGLMGEMCLPYGTLMVKNPRLQISLHTLVSQRPIKIQAHKSWLTTTLFSGIEEVLGAIEKT